MGEMRVKGPRSPTISVSYLLETQELSNVPSLDLQRVLVVGTCQYTCSLFEENVTVNTKTRRNNVADPHMIKSLRHYRYKEEENSSKGFELKGVKTL